MPFVLIPANQVAKKATKVKGVGKGNAPRTNTKQNTALKNSSTSARRATVTVAAYGGKLFEPIIAREQPIYVHFLEYIIRDDDAMTRFSEDGFFAIKTFLTNINNKSRCYLAYFKNGITPTEEHNLMTACHEAVDYELWEFEDNEEYTQAVIKKDIDGRLSDYGEYALKRLRLCSALGQAEQKIINILQEKIVAEKFLKSQREYKKQDEAWQIELQRLNRLEEEEKEEEDEILDRDIESNASECESEEIDNSTKAEKIKEVSTKEEQEISGDRVQGEERGKREEIEVVSSSNANVNREVIWGGRRK